MSIRATLVIAALAMISACWFMAIVMERLAAI